MLSSAAIRSTVVVVASMAVFAQSTRPAYATADGSKSTESNLEDSPRPEEVRKALALVDAVTRETSGLRLSQNRLPLFSTAAELLWPYEQEQARRLFKIVVSELVEIRKALVTANQARPSDEDSSETDEQKRATEVVDRLSGFSYAAERQILMTIARHDGKLVREYFEAAARLAPGPVEMAHSRESLQVELAVELAATEPAEALKLAELHLQNGLNGDLPLVVNGLLATDRDAAGKLSRMILNKLHSKNLNLSAKAAMVGASLLRVLRLARPVDTEARSGKNGEEQLISELVELLGSVAIGSATRSESSQPATEGEQDYRGVILLQDLKALLPEVKRYTPSRYDSIKSAIEAYERNLSPEVRAQNEYMETSATGSTEDLLRAADRTSGAWKERYYGEAALRMARNGDDAGAARLLDQHVTSPVKRLYRRMFEQIQLETFARNGDLDRARARFQRMSPCERAEVLLSFAKVATGKGDRAMASTVLEEARGAISSVPGDTEEIQMQLNIASEFSALGSPTSFEIVEPLADQLNELIAALRLTDRFEGRDHFRDGEVADQDASILMEAFLCAQLLAGMARQNFDRAKACADRFMQLELRLSALLAVARGVLPEPQSRRISRRE
jgi:hypothetical protein